MPFTLSLHILVILKMAKDAFVYVVRIVTSINTYNKIVAVRKEFMVIPKITF